MIDLPPDHLETVKRILDEHVPECEVRVFGSRVQWMTKDHSDLDLAVVGQGKIDKRRMNRLEEAFEESDLPIRVDVLDWWAISDSFRKVIGERFEVVLVTQKPKRASCYFGKLPSGWFLLELGKITCKIGSGATPKGGEQVYLAKKDKFSLVRSQCVFDRRFDETSLVFISDKHANKLKNAQVERGDILLNITGDGVTFGRSCVVPDSALPACVDQHVSIVRVKPDKAVPGFIVSFLTDPRIKRYIESFNSGGSRRAITKGHIESFEIPLPPLAEQQLIAHILSSLDDKIELNRRMNETLEAMARAIFKSWFVDFDPVRAKAEGRQPECMDPATAALFPDGFEDSELGEIPMGWSVKDVGGVFQVTMGQSPPGSTYNENGDGLPFFQGRRDFGFRYPKKRVYCSAPTRFANPGNTLVSVRAPVGDVNMASVRCCVGRGVAAVRHNEGSRSFTYCAMHDLQRHFEQFEAEGTVFGSITKSDFLRLPQVMIPDELVTSFEAVAAPIDQRIENLELEISTLTQLRDTLLPKLISGEIRVKDAEQMLETVR